MSRNASGTYSLPVGNPVSAGTTIEASWANTTMTDLGTEITDSLNRSGKGGMLAAFKATDGSAGAPGISFTDDLDTGIWRSAANTLNISTGGVERLEIDGTSADFTVPLVTTGTGLTITNDAPEIVLDDDNNTADEQKWRIRVDGGNLKIESLDDSDVVQATALDVQHGGTVDSGPGVDYDNSTSGLTATTVKGGLDELTQRLPRRNAILNEMMAIWREGESGRGTFSSGAWFADIWEWVQNGTTCAVTVVKDTSTLTGPSIAGYTPSGLAEVQVTTADASLSAGDYALVRTFVEGYDATALRQKKLKLRFVTAHNRTGTHTVTLSNEDYDRQIVFEYTQSVADTAELHEFEIPASPSAGTWNSTNGVGFYLTFTLASGTTQEISGSTGEWLNESAKWTTSNQVNGVASTSDRFRFGCVRLVPADTDVNEMDVQPLPIAEELHRCSRYLNSNFDPTGTSYGTQVLRAPGDQGTSAYAEWSFFPTLMRATPTMSSSNVSYFSANSLNLFNGRNYGFEPYITITGGGGYCNFDWTADARP